MACSNAKQTHSLNTDEFIPCEPNILSLHKGHVLARGGPVPIRSLHTAASSSLITWHGVRRL